MSRTEDRRTRAMSAYRCRHSELGKDTIASVLQILVMYITKNTQTWQLSVSVPDKVLSNNNCMYVYSLCG